jgi:chromosome segregation ATPase
MEERDQAYAARDEARKQKADEERAANDARQQAQEALAMNAVLADRLAGAERARDATVAAKQSEERLRAQAEADIEVFRQQAHTLQVERDAALRENESVLERLDQALGARRLAVAAKAEALKQAEEATKRCEQAEQKAKAETRRADEMEAKVREAIDELNKMQDRAGDLSGELREAHEAAQEYKELKDEAERECEAARRQVRGLNEEMLSVLKARDLALQQRDEAFARQKPPQLLEDAGGGSNRSLAPARRSPVPPSSAPSSETTSALPQWTREMEELRSILRAALSALQTGDSPSRSAQPPPPPPPSDTSDLGPFIRSVKADAGEVALKAAAVQEKYQRAMQVQREARNRVDMLESKLQNMDKVTQELEQLRQRAVETEQALRVYAASAATGGGPTSPAQQAGTEAVRRELRDRMQECDALREERKALYLEVKELTYQLNRATPQRREVDSLKEKLQQVLNDFDRVEAENRRLKGL